MIRYLSRKTKSHPRQQKRSNKSVLCSHATADKAPPTGESPTAVNNDQSQNEKFEPITTISEPVQNQSKLVPEKCEECVAEKRAARKYRWKLLLCLLPVFFLSSLDLTVVATALPFIASRFDKLNQLNWIVTAYTLTSAAFIPAFGQLADVFGRHATLQFAVAFMIVGSTLCAAAVNWPMLLLGRALQGVSAAGIQNVTMIILADSVSLKEQAVNNSIFQLMNGVGYCTGPLIGGYITNTNWRYCFVLAIGIAVISSPTIFLLRKDLKPGKISLSRIPAQQSRLHSLWDGLAELDIGGMVLFIFGTGLIILATGWGGSTFAWSSPEVLSSLIIGCIVVVLFAGYENLLEPGHKLARILPRTTPMLPFKLLQKRDLALIAFIAAATNAAVYSVFYFIGIYFTLVKNYPASRAGIQLLYYIPGIGTGVYLAIYLCNVRPRQTIWPLWIGTVIETSGLAVLTYAVRARKSTLVNVMMAIAGIGTGMRFMPMNLHLAGFFRPQLAAAYSILRFALPFGGTLALTIMGAVFQNKMAFAFGSSHVQSSSNGSSSFNVHNQAALSSISHLPAAEQKAIRAAGANATMWAFVSILPILGLSVLASMGLGNVWIAPKPQQAISQRVAESVVSTAEAKEGTVDSSSAAAIAVPKAPGSEYIDSIYFIALLRGSVKSQKKMTMAASQ